MAVAEAAVPPGDRPLVSRSCGSDSRSTSRPAARRSTADSDEGQRLMLANAAAMNYGFAFRMATYAALQADRRVTSSAARGGRLVVDSPHNSIYEEPLAGDGGPPSCTGTTPAGPTRPSGARRARRSPSTGQAVLLPGTSRTSSYLAVAGPQAADSLYSACHGAGTLVADFAARRAVRRYIRTATRRCGSATTTRRRPSVRALRRQRRQRGGRRPRRPRTGPAGRPDAPDRGAQLTALGQTRRGCSRCCLQRARPALAAARAGRERDRHRRPTVRRRVAEAARAAAGTPVALVGGRRLRWLARRAGVRVRSRVRRAARRCRRRWRSPGVAGRRCAGSPARCSPCRAG